MASSTPQMNNTNFNSYSDTVNAGFGGLQDPPASFQSTSYFGTDELELYSTYRYQDPCCSESQDPASISMTSSNSSTASVSSNESAAKVGSVVVPTYVASPFPYPETFTKPITPLESYQRYESSLNSTLSEQLQGQQQTNLNEQAGFSKPFDFGVSPSFTASNNTTTTSTISSNVTTTSSSNSSQSTQEPRSSESTRRRLNFPIQVTFNTSSQPSSTTVSQTTEQSTQQQNKFLLLPPRKSTKEGVIPLPSGVARIPIESNMSLNSNSNINSTTSNTEAPIKISLGGLKLRKQGTPIVGTPSTSIAVPSTPNPLLTPLYPYLDAAMTEKIQPETPMQWQNEVSPRWNSMSEMIETPLSITTSILPQHSNVTITNEEGNGDCWTPFGIRMDSEQNTHQSIAQPSLSMSTRLYPSTETQPNYLNNVDLTALDQQLARQTRFIGKFATDVESLSQNITSVRTHTELKLSVGNKGTIEVLTPSLISPSSGLLRVGCLPSAKEWMQYILSPVSNPSIVEIRVSVLSIVTTPLKKRSLIIAIEAHMIKPLQTSDWIRFTSGQKDAWNQFAIALGTTVEELQSNSKGKRTRETDVFLDTQSNKSSKSLTSTAPQSSSSSSGRPISSVHSNYISSVTPTSTKVSQQTNSMQTDEQQVETGLIDRLQQTFCHGAVPEYIHKLHHVHPSPILNVNLRPYQQQALNWMVYREQPSDHTHISLPEGWTELQTSTGKTYYLNSSTKQTQWSFPYDTWATEQDRIRNTVGPSAISVGVRGGILADDMGMGKTIQIISLIATNQKPETSFNDGRSKTTLVVTPLSVLQQWHGEIMNNTAENSLSVYIYHGADRVKDAAHLSQFDVVLTTFATLASEFLPQAPTQKSPLFRVQWYRVVLDEAHTIKDKSTRTAKAACILDSERRWIVTGTPIQNRLSEMYSLLHFLHVTPYGDEQWWSHTIMRPIRNHDDRGLARLQAALSNVLLRRTKDQTCVDETGMTKRVVELPPRTVTLSVEPFSPAEASFYSALWEQSRSKFNRLVADGTVLQNYAHILELLLRLRQACDHPALINRPQDGLQNFAAELPTNTSSSIPSYINTSPVIPMPYATAGESQPLPLQYDDDMHPDDLQRFHHGVPALTASTALPLEFASRDHPESSRSAQMQPDERSPSLPHELPLRNGTLHIDQVDRSGGVHYDEPSANGEIYDGRPSLGGLQQQYQPLDGTVRSTVLMEISDQSQQGLASIGENNTLPEILSIHDGHRMRISSNSSVAVSWNEEHECSICLEPISTDSDSDSTTAGSDIASSIVEDHAMVAPCNHIFCRGCLAKYSPDKLHFDALLPDSKPAAATSAAAASQPKQEEASYPTEMTSSPRSDSSKGNHLSIPFPCPICKATITLSSMKPVDVNSCGLSTYSMGDISLQSPVHNISAAAAATPKAVNNPNFDYSFSSQSSLLFNKSSTRSTRSSISKTIQRSTKIMALLKELADLRSNTSSKLDNGTSTMEKSIIFSQWTSMLDILETPLTQEGYQFVRLDGTMSQAQRENSIRNFKNDPSISLFLISMKAGGLGLNLTEANHVFILDPWWSPSIESQAIDRVHRIGQTKPVTITRFIIKDSIEERILELQERKKKLAKSVLGTGSELKGIALQDLRTLFS